MDTLPPSLTKLTGALNNLPGIGPRSAERLALHLVLSEAVVSDQLVEAIRGAREQVRLCERCGGLTETSPCPLCDDPRRETNTLCVVERPVDILLVEKAAVFKGRFHVLGGKLSPLDGVEPEDLRIAELERRIAPEQIQEIILAMPTDVEGDATCHYLAQRLKSAGVKVTRLAHGLPAGSGLDYADELTLGRALEGRGEIS